jgi:hypothetical protein
MPGLLILTCLTFAFTQVQSHVDEIGAIRFAHFEVLCQQCKVAVAAADDSPHFAPMRKADNPFVATLCREYASKFLALAEENPDDETALHCCEWVIVHGDPTAGDRALSEADAAAWDMMRRYHFYSERLTALCVEAAKHPTAAREQFLRSLPEDYRQPVEVHGTAYLALAEMLAKKRDFVLTINELDNQTLPEWRDYLASAKADQLRRESADLYRHVLAHYAELPYVASVSETGENTLGERAAKQLAALKKVETVGAVLPNIPIGTRRQLGNLSGN